MSRPRTSSVFYVLLVEWWDESKLFTDERRIIETMSDALQAIADIESDIAHVAAVLRCGVGLVTEDVTVLAASLVEGHDIGAPKFIARHLHGYTIPHIGVLQHEAP